MRDLSWGGELGTSVRTAFRVQPQMDMSKLRQHGQDIIVYIFGFYSIPLNCISHISK